MNGMITIEPQVVTIADIYNNDQLFAKLDNVSSIMANGNMTIPKHLQGNKSDCFAIAIQSYQWNTSPFAVAQKTFQIGGKLGYEAQLVTAIINNNAPITSRLNYELTGDWDKYIDNGLQKSDEKGLKCRVWATFIGEDEPRELVVRLTSCKIRNSTNWKNDPETQIKYVASQRWSRIFCPDVILGVYTADELPADSQPQHRGFNNAKVVTPTKTATDELFDALKEEPPADQVKPLTVSSQQSAVVEQPAEVVKEVEVVESAENTVLTVSAMLQALDNPPRTIVADYFKQIEDKSGLRVQSLVELTAAQIKFVIDNAESFKAQISACLDMAANE